MYPEIAFANWAFSGAVGDACSDADPSTRGIGIHIAYISGYDFLRFPPSRPLGTSEKDIVILEYFSIMLVHKESKKIVFRRVLIL